MKWTDGKNYILFKYLEIGGSFECNGNLYIKIDEKHAFDIINNQRSYFNPISKVRRRGCEIVFH